MQEGQAPEATVLTTKGRMCQVPEAFGVVGKSRGLCLPPLEGGKESGRSLGCWAHLPAKLPLICRICWDSWVQTLGCTNNDRTEIMAGQWCAWCGRYGSQDHHASHQQNCEGCRAGKIVLSSAGQLGKCEDPSSILGNHIKSLTQRQMWIPGAPWLSSPDNW